MDAAPDALPDADADVAPDFGPAPDVACPAGQTRCDGICVDTRADVAHCGRCGTRCAAAQACARGLCVGRESGDLAVGYNHTCVHVDDGDCNGVWCWGLASSCEFVPSGTDAGAPSCRGGDAPTYPRARRVDVPGRVRQLAAASTFTCAITDDAMGVGAVYCWGRNGYGQLGDGTTTSRPRPTRVVGLPAPAVQIDCGNGVANTQACALLEDGRVYCWGSNVGGVLGAPDEMIGGVTRTCDEQFGTARYTYPCSPTARQVSGLPRAIQVSVGGGHACIIDESRTVWCWGGAGSSTMELGLTNPMPQGALHRMSIPGFNNVVQISAGTGVTCAVREDGRVLCWGSNSLCMLGDGTMVASRAEPAPVFGLSNARQVALGFGHACAALGTNEVRCWGTNNSSFADAAMVRPCTVATGGYSGVSPPVALRGLTAPNVDEIRQMGEFSCVKTGARAVQCWGNAANGQLGDNNGHVTPGTRLPPTPTPVLGICSE